MSKALPLDITSYDLLKTFAVITMIIDHVGAYFFPDELWFRAIGRLSFPVWLFLIGYARSRDISPRLIGGAAVLFVSGFIFGEGIFPANILFTIIIARLVLDRAMGLMMPSKLRFWGGAVLLFALALPSMAVFEFGTLAIMIAMLGYLVRRREEIGQSDVTLPYAIFAILCFAVLQGVGYGLQGPQLVVLGLGAAALLFTFWRFDLRTYPGLTQKLGPLSHGVKLMGRRTLEIYVLHLLLFKLVAVIYGFSGHDWFAWYWVN